MLRLNLDPELDARLTAVAKRMGVSKSEIVRQAIARKFEQLDAGQVEAVALSADLA